MRSRMHWWLAEREARRRRPGSQALLLNHEGHVTETATANFLLVKEGVVVSPPAGDVLPGVSLKVTRELCGQLGIPFVERPIKPEECGPAEEAILCSTPYCLAGVRDIDGRPLAFPGKILLSLLELWNEKVGLDIWSQFA
jgi:branched-subunit amino acid aminotransferase/4-amino-4-deoxychorismate lyase